MNERLPSTDNFEKQLSASLKCVNSGYRIHAKLSTKMSITFRVQVERAQAVNISPFQ